MLRRDAKTYTSGPLNRLKRIKSDLKGEESDYCFSWELQQHKTKKRFFADFP